MLLKIYCQTGRTGNCNLLWICQKKQYDYQLQQSAAVRRFKHDLVNHIGVLRELMNEKKTEEAKEYIDTIWDMQDEFDLRIHTGDSSLDVIVNYYLYLAIKENIEFVVWGKLSEKCHWRCLILPH